MAKAKSTKIKMNPLERWLKCGELSRAIEASLPVHLRCKPLEEIFTGTHAGLTPEVREMYALMLRLKAYKYGQNV